MVVGSAILCTRGGDTEGALRRLRDALAEGRRVMMVPLEAVPDRWLAFTVFGVGGGGAWEHVVARMAARGAAQGTLAPSAALAVDALARHVGRPFDAVFEAEAGGATVTALLTAARLNIPIVDGCPSGRCLPEVQMNPFFLMSRIPRAPLAVATRYGDLLLIPKVVDDYRVEDLTRALAVASGGSVSVAANAVPGDVLRRHLVPGFLSRAIRLGAAARSAAAVGRDPVEAVATAGEGFVLFRGIVRESVSRGEGGFGWTEARLEGIGQFAGSHYRIFNKNENLIAWRDGKLDAAAPDLICPLDPKTGWATRAGGIVGSFPVGQEVAIVGFPAHSLWRAPAAIDMLGPRRFGFDEEYVPVERLHQAR